MFYLKLGEILNLTKNMKKNRFWFRKGKDQWSKLEEKDENNTSKN